MAEKPYFPANYLHYRHGIAGREARGDMEEWTSVQPFGADCDGLIALISTYPFLLNLTDGCWDFVKFPV